MSFAETMRELPAFSVAERQLLLRRVMELDDPGLSPEDQSIIRKRWEDHLGNPSSAISFDEITTSLRSSFGQ